MTTVFISAVALSALPRLSLFSAVAMFIAASAAAAECVVPSATQQHRAAEATSAVRRAAGMAAVTVDPTLARVAAAQACAMAAAGKMVHSGGGRGPGRALRQAGYDWAAVAENIAAGPMDLDQTMDAWRASPHHHANLLLRGAQVVGVGEATAADGRTRFWAFVIAAPR